MFSPVHATNSSHGAFSRWHSTPVVDADLTLDTAATAEDLQSQLKACNGYATSVTSSWCSLGAASNDSGDISTKLPATVAELFGAYTSPTLASASNAAPLQDEADDFDCLSGPDMSPDSSAVPSNALKAQSTSYSILQYDDSVDSADSLISTYSLASQDSTSSSPWTAVHSWDSKTDQSDDELSLPDGEQYADAAADTAANSSAVSGGDDVTSVASSSTTQPLVPSDSTTISNTSSQQGDDFWTCPICLEPPPKDGAAQPDTCKHNFCTTCLQRWLRVSSYPTKQHPHGCATCPVCSERFYAVVPVRVNNTNEAVCYVCKLGTDEANLILCDGCDIRGVHCYHHTPRFRKAPTENFYCIRCRYRGDWRISREEMRLKKLHQTTDTKQVAAVSQPALKPKAPASAPKPKQIKPLKAVTPPPKSATTATAVATPKRQPRPVAEPATAPARSTRKSATDDTEFHAIDVLLPPSDVNRLNKRRKLFEEKLEESMQSITDAPLLTQFSCPADVQPAAHFTLIHIHGRSIRLRRQPDPTASPAAVTSQAASRTVVAIPFVEPDVRKDAALSPLSSSRHVLQSTPKTEPTIALTKPAVKLRSSVISAPVNTPPPHEFRRYLPLNRNGLIARAYGQWRKLQRFNFTHQTAALDVQVQRTIKLLEPLITPAVSVCLTSLIQAAEQTQAADAADDDVMIIEPVEVKKPAAASNTNTDELILQSTNTWYRIAVTNSWHQLPVEEMSGMVIEKLQPILTKLLTYLLAQPDHSILFT